MSNGRTDLDSTSIDTDGIDELAVIRLKIELYTSISALWLANSLAILCLIGSYHAEVIIGKPWHIQELFYVLIGSPYGGVLLRKLSNARSK